MSSLLKKAYPFLFFNISLIIGSGYCFRLITLFNSLRSLIQRTLPSFFGIMNVGEAHSLVPWGDNTPNSTKC